MRSSVNKYKTKTEVQIIKTKF